MKSRLRASTMAFASLFIFGCGALSAIGADLDTSRLPRVSGGKEIYASTASTIFTTPQTVSQTTAALSLSLAAQGWQRYIAPFTSYANDPNSTTLSFKKGPQGLSVYITVAPAQNNATSVQYGAIALQTDLPFPPDATDIEYSPTRPHLICKTAQPVGAALAFFGAELAAQGWSAWSTRDAAKIPPGSPIGDVTPKGGYAWFVQDGKPPIMLILQRGDDARTRVEIKVISPSELNPQIARDAAAAASAREAAQKAAAQEAARERAARTDAQFDAMTADIMKQAQRAITDPPAVPKAAPPANTPLLRARAESPAPAPLPETAEAIEFDAADGKLEFQASSSVTAIADFYRAAMPPLGWKEQRSIINRSNMVVLDFLKDRKKISLTIMQMGATVNVSGSGSGLTTAASPAVSARAGRGAASEPETIEALEAEETGGLPVPKKHTASGSESTPFRTEATATTSAGIGSVVAFYRRELASRNWKEEPGAAIGPDKALVNFSSADGPAVLKVERKSDETTVSLALRKKAFAEKSGLMPKPGQVRVIFGNMLDAESVITINKKAVKVAPGAGKSGTDGPSMELPPGNYRYSIKTGARPAQSDEVKVGAGEIWGVLIGPGGGLALQMY